MHRFFQKHVAFMLITLLAATGCDMTIFPIWEPNIFETNPAELGTFGFNEARFEIDDGADGEPVGFTVFTPEGATEPLPAFVWVLGSNVQAYYHQSLHEALASWGYAVIVPDTRLLTFTDFEYHKRNTDIALQAVQKAVDGDFGVQVDADRIAAGGYSIGGTMAAFAAAQDDRIKALVFWAPSDAPFWTGVDPDALLPMVDMPSLFLLAEFDNITPSDGWPATMQSLMAASTKTVQTIEMGLHLFFQQPTGADSEDDPETTLTREEQQGIAINATRAYLDEQIGAAP